ncbi:putative bifunctional diguanylate cyclase/phosphodiesterase [Hirschia baltica]|uniref:Diguanylate cyclase/phosphodiesterase n=1 Tax=Hirschia baltica (strain ATCC 49814 / DSM 5838 / IFAM 1418) TaxID=582402 RepID=C6XPY9_HIRBI|nr:bifunctional diguanylate cyclase/phosphodiesterase [Hirschia baltica]ACT58506.1 diguanylate cyclase/phosphodiesterase [Hirschia baltica ATCC 49814]
MASLIADIKSKFQAAAPDKMREVPMKSLLILVGISISLIFVVLWLVSFKGDEIAQKRQNVLFGAILESQTSITQDMTESLLALPGTTDMFFDSLSKREIHTKLTQRFADRLGTTDILISDIEGHILFRDASDISIYPTDLQILSPSLKRLRDKIQLSPNQNFASDRLILNDEVYHVSAREISMFDRVRYLYIATPVESIFSHSFLIPLNLKVIAGTHPPKQRADLYVLDLKSSDGKIVGWLSWQRHLPGITAIRHFLPTILLVAVIIGIISFLAWKRATALSNDIIFSHQEAQKLALHDPLTGLANRMLLKKQIETAKADVKRGREGFALHLIDLDKFKDINDTMGHPAGDELIRQAATRLKDACRANDTVARIGGDEFAVIQIEATSTNTVSRLARRINEQMARAFVINNTEVYVSASIGIAIDATGESQQEEIHRRADIALYKAKEAGRDQYCFFEDEMDAELKHKHKIERDLRQALQEPDKNGLRVVYQPQVSANGRHIRGFEALIRWEHPVRGNVSPVDFIPIAEETNLVIALDEFVMKEAFKTALKWPEVTMAVNVSAKELHQDNYPHKIIALASEYNIRPDQIELEITESVLLEDSPRVAKTLKILKAAGFKIALDDFGTGYSSLSYLRRHQVDKLKIDQSFVASIGVREDASAVVQAILSLGESLGLSVTAEGVETIEQRDSLRKRGCAYLQGYLFSKPLEEKSIVQIMKKFKDRNDQQRLQKIS